MTSNKLRTFVLLPNFCFTKTSATFLNADVSYYPVPINIV